MTFHPEMNHDDIAHAKLDVLRREHRDLDEAISALANQPGTSSLTLQRLKRRKLALKDQITQLEDELTPDIIA
ncbi:MAG: YdcH family protein [Paracoccus sp. (in: a-proteobacteria)]